MFLMNLTIIRRLTCLNKQTKIFPIYYIKYRYIITEVRKFSFSYHLTGHHETYHVMYFFHRKIFYIFSRTRYLALCVCNLKIVFFYISNMIRNITRFKSMTECLMLIFRTSKFSILSNVNIFLFLY